MREEHDFGLNRFDIEVKTTLSEDRRHRVSSLTQLEPSARQESLAGVTTAYDVRRRWHDAT